MIDLFCGCRGAPRRVDESGIGQSHACEKCGRIVRLACAEPLEAGNGAGDFDAALTVVSGPDCVGEQIQLGGVADIEIGKALERHVCLSAGKKVSRLHAKLVRVDFGPSRWRIVDRHSTNGLFVNEGRCLDQELKDGDLITVGDYTLKFGHTRTIRAAGDVFCPACDKLLAKKAKICVDCGITVATGRPVLTRQGVDENALYAGAESWIRIISLLVWVTPFPIPIRSEAFGTRKPYAIWTIALATILASITFFVALRTGDQRAGAAPPGTNLMLWAPADGKTAADETTSKVSAKEIHDIALKMDVDDRAELLAAYAKPGEKVSDDELVSRAIADLAADRADASGEFHAYQLITHAFLHDPSSIYGFAMHLGGNLVFMLCFGTRVNALIGNIATAILYPVLAVSAALIHLLTDGGPGPMVGASGAIMGLAGMYLILFPVHNVFCAMWISLWFRFRRIFGLKIFSLRGFWILLIYFGYDIAMNLLNTHYGLQDSVAHWAHIGGFVTGSVIAMGLLLSRLFDTHGGDVLSVILGPRAWAIIGKPGHRRKKQATEVGSGVPAYG
ncbi:MAG TPA: rhomboid family intramembrane serine protease [Tepidisphaeraceae bacterium]|jgi:membrane associated rhomboid family serine protease/pSer/pThr/pTyr-binding forkhead associated (FHA) protein